MTTARERFTGDPMDDNNLPAAIGMNCLACVFWVEATERGDTARNGVCRRMPPQILYDQEDGPLCLWPVTEDGDWCGEFMRVQQ